MDVALDRVMAQAKQGPCLLALHGPPDSQALGCVSRSLPRHSERATIPEEVEKVIRRLKLIHRRREKHSALN